MISVIIPSFKNPKYLDLCLKSIIENQEAKNEIIVVLDGYADLSRDVIEKYKDSISVLEFEENRGMSSAINYGVYNATNEWILVVSEDNVFCKDWDTILVNHPAINNKLIKNNSVITINQIEPTGPSIYNFIIQDFGKDIEEFQLETFLKEEPKFRKLNIYDTNDGSTFPFMMKKIDFLKVGGFDIDYPSPFVVDWDFFLKCELVDLNLVRFLHLNFYHFVSKSTKNRNGYIENPNEKTEFFSGEQKAAEYFQYKWGFPPKRDKNNKCKQFLNF